MRAVLGEARAADDAVSRARAAVNAGDRRFMHTWAKLPEAELLTMCALKDLPTASRSADEMVTLLEDLMLYKNPELAVAKDVSMFPRDPRFTTTGGTAIQVCRTNQQLPKEESSFSIEESSDF